MPRKNLLLVAFLVAACTKTAATQSTAPTTTGAGGATAVSPAAATTIEGTVSGHDGTPLPLAHVRILGDKTSDTKVARDGTFTFDVSRQGLAQLEVTGVNHAQTAFMVVLDGTPLKLDIQLGTYPRQEPLGTVSALVWTEDPSGGGRPETIGLTPQSNGTLAATVKASGERVWYQLFGTSGPGRSVNGPQAHAYAYDGGGDYRSILLPSDGKVEITVDPATLVPAGAARVLSFSGDNPTRRIADVLAAADDEQERVTAMVRESKPQSGQEARAVASAYDFGPARGAVLTALAAEEHPIARRAMLAAYFGLGSFPPADAADADRARAAELVGGLATDDPGWQMYATAMIRAAELSNDPRDAERLRTLLDEKLDPELAAGILFSRLMDATMSNDEAKQRDAYKRLQTPRFGKTPYFFISKQFNPDSAIRTGKKFPKFEVAAIRGNNKKAAKTLRNEDLTGKVYLVDLWATWCKPCVAEMDNLHAAYAKHAGAKGRRPFEILSISVDKGTDEVDAFRKDRFPMPWRHAHLDFDEAGQLFGVAGIPYAVLLDETGTILATSPQVSGASLDSILERVLAEPAP